MATKVKAAQDDEVKQARAERGVRSRIMRHWLPREMKGIRRRRADERLQTLQRGGEAVSTSAVVSALRKDRWR